MRYLLCVLTMKGREEVLARTLASFERYVSPMPASLYVHVDGDGALPPVLYGGMEWHGEVDPEPVGFCRSTALAWDAVVAALNCDWAFWLEDDFEFLRPVDLGILARVMDAQPQLAQMALYRNSHNSDEVRHGGYMRLPGRTYARRATSLYDGTTRSLGDDECAEIDEAAWFEHNSYWTTNPSIFRRETAVRFDWPSPPKCEGKFGFELRAGRADTTFGVWGAGACWINHHDDRRGNGKGY